MMDSDEMSGVCGMHAKTGWDYQNKAGWQLLPIRHKTKQPSSPYGNKWTDPSYNFSVGLLTGTDGLGLVHAKSGTMALDIDDWKESEKLLSLAGIDLEELYNSPNAVTINSGVENRGKLLYRMPNGLTPSKHVDKTLDGNVIHEFRCGGCYDVLPPSIHPSGGPYQWGGLGDWKKLPMIPVSLLDIWEEAIRNKSEIVLTDKPRKTSKTVNYEDIGNALCCIPADCDRENWIRIGMALHSIEDGIHAFNIWDQWSSKGGDKYPGRRYLTSQWRSFKTFKDDSNLKDRSQGGVITLGTLFHIAKKYSYTPPPHLASHLFKEITREASIYSDNLFDSGLSLFNKKSLFDKGAHEW